VQVPSAATAAPSSDPRPTAEQVSSVTAPLALPTATPQDVDAVAAALDSQGVATMVSPLFATVRTVDTLPSGSTVVLERPRVAPGTVTPQFSVGAGWGIYVQLNRSDQTVLVNAGAAGLAVLICEATALVGCAAATAACACAATWVSNRGGICPRRLEIRILPWMNTYSCVK
jgi:hypothetical protein